MKKFSMFIQKIINLQVLYEINLKFEVKQSKLGILFSTNFYDWNLALSLGLCFPNLIRIQTNSITVKMIDKILKKKTKHLKAYCSVKWDVQHLISPSSEEFWQICLNSTSSIRTSDFSASQLKVLGKIRSQFHKSVTEILK